MTQFMPILGTSVNPLCAQLGASSSLPVLGTLSLMNNLRRLREALGWSQDLAAAKMGTTRNQYVKLERGPSKGGRRLSEIWIDRAARAFQVDPGQIVSASDEPNRTVPIMGYVGAGAVVEPDFEQVPPEGLDTIELPFAVPEDIIGLRVRGESMRPVYRDGDAVLVYRDQRLSTDNYVGEEAAVRTDDGRRFLKTILRGTSRATYTLDSFNAAPIEGVRIQWVGEIFLVVKASQIARLARNRRVAAQRRSRVRADSGTDELPLDGE
jgi:repressor LexA